MMYMKDEKIVEIDDYRLELENRIRNLLWTISGDYTLNMKEDVSLYLLLLQKFQFFHLVLLYITIIVQFVL